MASIEEKVEAFVAKPIEKLGYELYDVEYAKEGKDYFLRIYINKPEGIDLNDCEKVNNAINEMLDTQDYLKEAYFLEVSSPGIERTLRKDKHLEGALGEKILIKLFKPFDGKRELEGILEAYNQDEITIQEENEKEEKIARKDISLMKIKCDW
ncbi:MAG: ribosome maturation factor RimP [Clostridia bacterium]